MDLAQHINLEGPWQVALTEISYPHTWFNIPPQSVYFDWKKKPTPNPKDPMWRARSARFRGGYNTDLDQLKVEI